MTKEWHEGNTWDYRMRTTNTADNMRLSVTLNWDNIRTEHTNLLFERTKEIRNVQKHIITSGLPCWTLAIVWRIAWLFDIWLFSHLQVVNYRVTDILLSWDQERRFWLNEEPLKHYANSLTARPVFVNRGSASSINFTLLFLMLYCSKSQAVSTYILLPHIRYKLWRTITCIYVLFSLYFILSKYVR
jgi:hypothetical protein